MIRAVRIPLTRRDFLAHTASAAAVFTGARAWAQAPPELELVELSERLAVIRGAGANITVLAADEGLLLVDCGLAERAEALLGLLQSRWPDRPVREVFNTNWRPEHTGANAALRAAGARIHAHENTRLWMGARFEVKWQGVRHLPQAPETLPTDTFYDSGRLELGGSEIRYEHAKRAHTDGDLYVHFPDDNVLAVGDLLAVGRYPLPDFETGGFIGGFVAASEALLERCDAETRIVAADGGVHSPAALEAQLALCRAAMAQVRATYRAGGTLEDYIAAAAELADDRGDPTVFLTLVYEGGYYRSGELGGVI